MSETPGVTKNEGIQKLLEAEKEATKIVDEARQRKLSIKIGAERTQSAVPCPRYLVISTYCVWF